MHRTGQSGAPPGPVKVSAPRDRGDGRRGSCVVSSPSHHRRRPPVRRARRRAGLGRRALAQRSLRAAALRRGHLAFVRPARRYTHGAARGQRDIRREAVGLHLADEHRRVPVEHAGRARGRAHRPPRGDRADGAHPGDARAHGARTERAVLQLVRPGHGGASDHVARRRLAAVPLPVVGRQRLARRRAEDRRERGARAARGGARAGGRDGLRLLLRLGQGSAARRRMDRAAPRLQRRAGRRMDDLQRLRRPELRAADRELPGHRGRPGPARALLPPRAHLLAAVRGRRLPGDAAQRRDADLSGRRRLRGPLRLPRHAHRPHLGRRHVRGDDADALRARGALGRAVWGVNHPLYVRAQIEHGLDEARYG